MKGLILVLAGLLAVSVIHDPAAAQAVPDIQDAISRGNSIDDALREQRRTSLQPSAEDEGEIDGEAGVYVLTVNDIFFIGASVGSGWEENPVRTIDDVGNSVFATAAVSAGIQTKLGDTVDAGLAVTASGIEYEADFAPSSRSVSASANLGLPLGRSPLYLGLTAYGGYSFDGGFDNGTAFYGASIGVSAAVPLGQRGLLRGSLSGGRALNDISENNAWNANLSVGIAHRVTPDLTIAADARVSRIWFDDFFEDVTFVARKDWQYGGNLTGTYAINDWISASVSAGYEKRDSGFFLSNYDGFAASVVLTARKRF